MSLGDLLLMCFGFLHFLFVLGIIEILVVFIKFGTFSTIISSNIFPIPLLLSHWDSTYTAVELFEVVPQLTQALSIFNIFFLYFWVFCVAVPASSLAFSSAVSNLLSTASNAFFLIKML